MDEMKDKMKGFIKKVTPSSSSKFTGQGRVLGSSSSSPSTPATSVNSRLLNPPTNPNPNPNPKPKPKPPPRTPNPPSDPVSSAAAESVRLFLSAGPREEAVEIALRLLRNVAREPGSEKFRRIRMGNPKIKEAVGDDAEGWAGMLESVGFRFGEEEEGEGEVWATMGAPTEEMIAGIKEAVAALERWKGKDSKGGGGADVVAAVAVKPDVAVETKPIDRQIRVFFSVSESVAANIDLPDNFYNLSSEEIRREAQSRKKKLEESQLLVPKSYKEKQANAARKKYKFTVIRVQFPDGIVLQGIFRPSEPTTSLYEFVSSSLKEPGLEFELLSPAAPKLRVIPRFPIAGDKRASTLEEERLVPSALIKFKPIETDSVVFTGLINELLEIGEPLTSNTTAL